VLLMHSKDDELVPFEHALWLQKECKQPFEPWWPSNARHARFPRWDNHWSEHIRAFLTELNDGVQLVVKVEPLLPVDTEPLDSFEPSSGADETRALRSEETPEGSAPSSPIHKPRQNGPPRAPTSPLPPIRHLLMDDQIIGEPTTDSQDLQPGGYEHPFEIEASRATQQAPHNTQPDCTSDSSCHVAISLNTSSRPNLCPDT